MMPSNSLASVYGLLQECADAKVLGDDVDIEIDAHDETNTVIKVNRIIRNIRSADAGFVGLAHAWANGTDLDHLIEDEEMSGGDFVRNVKQLIDLLRQLALVAPDPSTRSAAGAAADALFRGVVAASSTVST